MVKHTKLASVKGKAKAAATPAVAHKNAGVLMRKPASAKTNGKPKATATAMTGSSAAANNQAYHSSSSATALTPSPQQTRHRFWRQLRLEELPAVCMSRTPFCFATPDDIAKLCKQLITEARGGANANRLLGTLGHISVSCHHFDAQRLKVALSYAGAVPLCSKLQKHKDSDVASFASRLVNSWRLAVDAAGEEEVRPNPFIVPSSPETSSSV